MPPVPTIAFGWPLLLWLLVIPVIQIVWDIRHRRRQAISSRPKILRAEAGNHSLRLAVDDTKAVIKATRPRWWLCLGLILCITALARPQWGRLEEPVFEQAREIMLAIDLSRSMLAQDVRPTRLDRAKLLIRSLLEKLAGERVGLIVFSGTAFLQSPLSADYEILLEFLPALGPEFLPEGGTNYKPLINTAINAFASTSAADRFMIILSDGEATDEDWRERVAELKAKGVRVIGLGVGTSVGAMIPDDAGGFVKNDRGAVVMTKLESATLQELSRATSGVYRDASSWVDLAALLKETIEAGQKGQFVETNTIRLVERFQWPLAFGLWLLFVSYCFEFPVRPRPRDITLRHVAALHTAQPIPARGGKAPVATTTTAAILVLFVLLGAWQPAIAAVAVPNAPSDVTKAGPKEPPPSAALAKVVGRLALAPAQSARDWADFGRETVSWGMRLQTGQQQIPEGPVRDALSAVDLGEKLDAKATDWPKLRLQLEEFLKKDDQRPPDQSDEQQKQDQKQDQEKQDQQQNNTSNNPQPQNQKQDQKPPDQQQQQQQGKGDSAFGDMHDKDDKPPQPSEQSDTQKVGGSEKDEVPEVLDPSLALPLQKLDQLKNQDSPAQLFRLMEGDTKAPKKPAKDW